MLLGQMLCGLYRRSVLFSKSALIAESRRGTGICQGLGQFQGQATEICPVGGQARTHRVPSQFVRSLGVHKMVRKHGRMAARYVTARESAVREGA